MEVVKPLATTLYITHAKHLLFLRYKRPSDRTRELSQVIRTGENHWMDHLSGIERSDAEREIHATAATQHSCVMTVNA